MSFLAPAFLIGAAAAAIPIVLHLFRRHVEPEIRFSAVRFLRRAPVEQARRRRLRELLLLALRVTALLLLALSFARPFFSRMRAFAGGPVTIVAVDTSFSMSAPGQFDRARQLARQAVKAAPSDNRVGVVAFDDGATVVAQPDIERGSALAAIDRLNPGFGGTRYGPALTRAAEACGTAGRIVVVTDLQQVGWELGDRGAVPERISVEIADVGANASNLAVIAVRLDEGAVIASVRNTGTGARTSRARLVLDGRTVAEQVFSVAAGLAAEIRFAETMPASGVASVLVDDPDGYVGDNARFLVLDPPEPARVLAITNSGSVTKDAFYIERALSVADAAGTFHVAVTNGEDITAEDRLKPYTSVLLLGTKGLDRKGRDAMLAYLQHGGGALIAAGPDVEGDVVQAITADTAAVKLSAGRAANVRFAPADARHPVFRAFGAAVGNLGAVRFTRGGRIVDADGAQVLARFSDGSLALVEQVVGRGRVLLFGSDLNNEWNDFPLQPGFVPFIHESVKYLSALREEPRDVLVSDVPSDSEHHPGVIERPQSGGTPAPGSTRRIAVNVDPRESDPARVSTDTFAAAITRMKGAATVQARSRSAEEEETQRLWQYGLGLIILGLVAEGLLGSRMG